MVKAPSSYNRLMQRLAVSPVAVPPNFLERLRRNINKRYGRPSTPDVGEIASFISTIYSTSQALYPETIHKKIAISSPAIPALAIWDVNDAIEHVGLTSWLLTDGGGLYPGILSMGRAASGGWDIGLCDNYRKIYHCQAEAREKPIETVYTIS